MIFSLVPVKKQIMWGGDTLSKEFGIGEYGEKIAEAWELACREDGDNVISSGPYSGKTLSEYIKENPNAIGLKNNLSRFPLLIKLIDAHDDLSIQVHPDDEYAEKNTPDLGKTEMWYILDCDEGAHLIYGLNGKYSRQELEEAIKNGTLEKYMNYVPVKKGDVFFIPSNTVHAICKGILIAEIQQNSNITYRLYDYNRRQKDGSLRQLHIENGLDCIERYKEGAITSERYDDVISSNPYFKVRVVDVNGCFKMETNEDTFVHIMCVDGKCVINSNNETISIEKGQSVFCSASVDTLLVRSQKCKLVISSL